jgi:hypothetical protein
VREHLATCDLPHPDFEELGSVVPALLELDDSELVEPPAALRDRVMAAAAADLATRNGPTEAPPATEPLAAEPAGRPRSRSRPPRSGLPGRSVGRGRAGSTGRSGSRPSSRSSRSGRGA